MNNEPELQDLRVLCSVARRSSFAAAAAELGTSPAHVSKRIAILEAQLGVRLFHRTTRRVHISDDGETVYAWARRILDDLEAMRAEVGASRGEPAGLLRVSATLRLGRNHIAPVLSLLRRQHPSLELWLELVDRRVDLISEGFDLDIRVGEVLEPHVIAHRIARGARILCAAPAYLARRTVPKTLAELAQHDCLLFRDREFPFGVWRLQGPAGLETVKVTGPIGSNHSDVALSWALDGHGVIMMSTWDVAGRIADGALVQLLPHYRQPAEVWAVSSAKSTHSAKVRVCVEFLKEHLAQGPWALASELPG